MVFLKNFFKLIVLVFIAYTGLAVSFWFLSPPEYKTQDLGWWQPVTNIYHRPLAVMFQQGKLSNPFNWNTLDREDIVTNQNPLLLRSKESRKRDYKSFQLQNLTLPFKQNQQTAIIEPVNGLEDKYWAVVICIPEQSYCAQSDLYLKGRVRIVVDGDAEVWAVSLDGGFLALELDTYSVTQEDRDIPLL